MRRLNGQSPADDDPPTPTRIDRDRECDFCGAVPTTHWLTFTPAPRGSGYSLPGYLGACSECAAGIDFNDAEQIVRLGDQPEDVAELLAKHFLAIAEGK